VWEKYDFRVERMSLQPGWNPYAANALNYPVGGSRHVQCKVGREIGLGSALQDRARVDIDSTSKLEIIEPRVTPYPTEYWDNKYQLNAAPIVPAWVLDGSPAARGKLLSSSTDGMASTYMWDCTAGRFNWFYDIDETICLLEGSVVLTDSAGVSLLVRAGDTFLFPAGSRFEWTVPSYVRKVAFLHVPMSRKMQLLRRIYKALRRLTRPRTGKFESTTLLQGG
jgi:uncharacterized cupin superfamily protein